MRIYVDFDDCLCETAVAFAGMADRMFGIKVPYEQIRFFNLQDSFSLTDEQYREMMEEGHRPEVLLSYEETPGAVVTLNSWIDSGHGVFVITGRPASAYEASRLWLDEHGLGRADLYCLNKYGRNTDFFKSSTFNLELEDYYRMRFDYAVEDSPLAFRYFTHLPDMKVLVFDRPWNQSAELPGTNYIRCTGWEQIREQVAVSIRGTVL